ncbi:hypothetical protein PHLCEN_2v938 [Hermanssonia centrifuga]|uniref:Uncharacterized protein n=1 Tax=Hermanssonia centrifuga TaxID=98765 RepID=A0A2R6S4K1_9APHY|nr:hypothetical protein PHLCEN_2v938 [Hermanssonia centrifuga]
MDTYLQVVVLMPHAIQCWMFSLRRVARTERKRVALISERFDFQGPEIKE